MGRHRWPRCRAPGSSTCPPSPRPSASPATFDSRGHTAVAYWAAPDLAAREQFVMEVARQRLLAVVATSGAGHGLRQTRSRLLRARGSTWTLPVAYYQQVGWAGRAIDSADAGATLGRHRPASSGSTSRRQQCPTQATSNRCPTRRRRGVVEERACARIGHGTATGSAGVDAARDRGRRRGRTHAGGMDRDRRKSLYVYDTEKWDGIRAAGRGRHHARHAAAARWSSAGARRSGSGAVRAVSGVHGRPSCAWARASSRHRRGRAHVAAWRRHRARAAQALACWGRRRTQGDRRRDYRSGITYADTPDG